MPMVDVSGGALYFEERGDGSPVLLIHGTGCNLHNWGETVDRLAEQHRTISYDRRGYGRSNRSRPRDHVASLSDTLPPEVREEMLAESAATVTEFLPSRRPGTGEHLRRKQIESLACPIRTGRGPSGRHQRRLASTGRCKPIGCMHRPRLDRHLGAIPPQPTPGVIAAAAGTGFRPS